MSVALLPATEQLRLLKNKHISPSELAEEHIRRIERLNPALNAIIDFDPDRVRRQLAELPAGELQSLPITIKSSISTAGYRCEIGSALHAGHVPAEDAAAVSRLRQAGALILGTTNCPEFLMAYETDNLLYGRTNNPWDLERTPGGSSGGESAAIAAGLSAGGLGSDSGGSVREPAHFTGICSLKPTSGRIPAGGHLPPCLGPFSRLGAIGPMARTIPDVELLFRITSQAANATSSYKGVNESDAKQIPIGWFEDDGITSVTSETRSSIADAAEALRRRGFHLRSFRPKALEKARKLWHTFFVQCGAMFYEPTITGRRSELSPIFREFLQMAESQTPLTAATLLQAWAEADLIRDQILAEMKDCPLLLLAVASTPAFRHGEREWMIEGQKVQYLDAMRFTQWFNLLGAPAAVVPVGMSLEGLPIGVQVAGLPGQDELVLAVARALDSEFGYRIPPLH
jgi:Asp-tRNA(Asn)/Glu-tRNA(Gln) amidotransferase A subunit family amidase